MFRIDKHFTNASCVEEWVGIFENGYTLVPHSYPISLRPNLRLAGPGIKVLKGLAPYSAWHTTLAELTSHQPRLLIGRERHHSGRSTPSRVSYGNHQLECFSSQNAEALQVSSQETPLTSLLVAPFGTEPANRLFACKLHLSQSRDAVIHPSTFSSFTLLRHSQTHTRRHCLGHTSFFIHGDKRSIAYPSFSLG